VRLLLINPNTSAHITARLAASARAVLELGDELTAVTASEGPEVVRSAEMLAQADASSFTLAESHATNCDAIVLGISLDGAAHRLRELHQKLPIVGMTEAGLFTACLCAERIGMLTLGADLLPLYRQRVEEIGLSSRVVAYRAPEVANAFSADASLIDPEVLDQLSDACLQMQHEGAQAIVLAGAVLCGYAAALIARCGLPVLDGVACAVGHVRIALACKLSTN
jgi:allantoin racemase